MASISFETLKGYVLEEVLARLIRNTGYRLLVDVSQDEHELRNLPNGLGVRGRGGDHQVDVLGELAWIPAFTFPLRLIVEAKARQGRTGIDVIRNAVGVATDVNENFSRLSQGPGVPPLQRFSYRYAVFSTSGFSRPATTYALAHQISLVDLSTDDFEDIVQLCDDIAQALWTPISPTRAGGGVRQLRARLRDMLGTWPPGVAAPPVELGSGIADEVWARVALLVRERLAAIGELFVAMANGPYLLILRATNPDLVIETLNRLQTSDVQIHWTREWQDGTRWVITLPGASSEAELKFTLPKPVADWIFDSDHNAERRAMQFKEQFLSAITIYRYVNGRDRIYRLRFSPGQVARERDQRRLRVS